MKKQFNHVKDIRNQAKVFPIDKNGYALFFTEDRRFFIYATYTKKDLTASELIEVDFDTYMSLRADDVVENFAESMDHLGNILLKVKRQSILENLSVNQVLELSKK